MFYVQTPKEAVLYRIVEDKRIPFVEAYVEIGRFPTYEEAEEYAASLPNHKDLVLSWETKEGDDQ